MLDQASASPLLCVVGFACLLCIGIVAVYKSNRAASEAATAAATATATATAATAAAATVEAAAKVATAAAAAESAVVTSEIIQLHLEKVVMRLLPYYFIAIDHGDMTETDHKEPVLNDLCGYLEAKETTKKDIFVRGLRGRIENVQDLIMSAASRKKT
jgi:hypothetical protein